MYNIIVYKTEEGRQILLLENGILLEKYLEKDEDSQIEGNVYLGKVQNVLPGMGAAFVNIGEDKNTFIHLKDILPKIDIRKEVKNAKEDKVSIKELVKPGTPLLVQVKRAESYKKGARVSTHINLTGKHIVLMPEVGFITVSQKIEDPKQKEKLTKIIQEVLPENFGAIIRTSATKAKKEELEKDVENLLKKWKQIKELFDKEKKSFDEPKLLYKADSVVKKMLVDLTNQKIAGIIVNDKEIYDETLELIQELDVKHIDLKQVENSDFYEVYDLEKQLQKADNRKVWLKCGGFITIDNTEALTAIDVNSGKYIGTKSLEQTLYTVNREATYEIAKQLRLRDVGGIVVIDYIDMQENNNKAKIEKLLAEELKKDRSKTQVFGFTKLNLLEMTRKHIYG